MKNTIRCFLTIMALLMLIPSNVNAQKTEQILNYQQSKIEGDLLTVLRKKQVRTYINGFTKTTVRDELKVGSAKLELREGELYEGGAENIILTSSIHQEEDSELSRSIQSYALDEASLNLLGTLPIAEINSYYMLPESKNILLSDEYEGLGYEIDLYNKELEKITSYRPFGENGFTQSMDQFQKNKAAFIFFPVQKTSEPRLVLMNTKTGDIQFEIKLDSGYTISKLTLMGDYVLMKRHKSPSEQEVICIDSNGEHLWTKDGYVYAYTGIRENNEWYAFATSKVDYWFIDLKTGSVTDKKSLLEYTGGKSLGTDSWIDLEAVHGDREITILISKKGDDKFSKFSNQLIQIKGVHARPEKIDMIESSDRILLKKLSSKILLINSKNKIIKQL